MRILFLIPRDNMASARLRALQYIPILKQNDIVAESMIAPRTLSGKINLYRKLKEYDLVFIQRKLFQPWEIRLIRSFSHFLIYDMDDAVMFKDRGGPQPDQPVYERKFRGTAKSADLIIVGNRYLKEQVFPFHSNVEILPTCVDLDRHQTKIHQKKECITIGWIGSRSTLRYVESLRAVFNDLTRIHKNIELKIIADSFPDFPEIPVLKIPWQEETEIRELQSLDIGIMPLPEDRWTRGKCGFKLIQYMAVGVPAVCSPVGMNREIIQDGVNGFWASEHEEWCGKLDRLIRDSHLRKTIGMAGRATVEQYYSIEVTGKKLVNILERFRDR